MNTNKIKRNVVLYVIGVLLVGAIGGIITFQGNELGSLIFVFSPILMAALLRFFAGDGWKDAGLRLKLKGNWRWYIFSLLAYPLAIMLVIVIGLVLGINTINVSLDEFLTLFATGLATQLIPRLLFSLFEEWGWRGYLEPRLEALGVPDMQRHFIVGAIWAVWHLPLILTTDYTTLPYTLFLPFFIIGVTVSAIVYGQLRKASDTVWTSVLLHGLANTILWGIISQDLITFNDKLLFFPAPEGVLMIVLWGMLGWWLLSKRTKPTT